MRMKKAFLLFYNHRRFILLQGLGILNVKDNAESLSQWPTAMLMGSNSADFPPLRG